LVVELGDVELGDVASPLGVEYDLVNRQREQEPRESVADVGLAQGGQVNAVTAENVANRPIGAPTTMSPELKIHTSVSVRVSKAEMATCVGSREECLHAHVCQG
jgi:hypothetical protein